MDAYLLLQSDKTEQANALEYQWKECELSPLYYSVTARLPKVKSFTPESWNNPQIYLLPPLSEDMVTKEYRCWVEDLRDKEMTLIERIPQEAHLAGEEGWS